MTRNGFALAMLGLAFLSARASEPLRSELDAIRQDLKALRFERALAGVEAILGRPGLADSERVEALTLRSQARVASGKLDGAEEDFKEILRLDPDYAPDARIFPPKALARFTRAQQAVVSTIRLEVDPRDARVLVDDRERRPGTSGTFRVAAGDHALRVERRGFDAVEMPLRAMAGQETPLRVRLEPNSRPVVVVTELSGVAVRLDGRAAGVTGRPGGGEAAPNAPSELLIEDVPLGEHVLELAKPCYRTESVRTLVAVDLLDRSPLRLDIVRHAPAAARLKLSGGPAGAEVLVDGESRGRLPIAPVEICQGEREVEIRAGGRSVWWRKVSLGEEDTLELDVTPRPNVVLVGTDQWPAPLKALGETLTVRAVLPRPQGADLRRPEGWQGIVLPKDTDLALTVLEPAEGDLGPVPWLWSPLLRKVEKVLELRPAHARPSWDGCSIAARLADSRAGGPARVVEVTAGGPAASAGLRPGDRVLRVEGTKIESTRDFTSSLAARPPGAEISIEIATVRGETKAVRLTCGGSPSVRLAGAAPGASAVRAAWAAVDAAALPSGADAALANLALLLSKAGRQEAAVQVWRRVRFGERSGVGDGTVAYYLARDLEALGQEAAARELFEKAARSAGTAFNDAGPDIGPASADHARDLGGRPATAR